MLLIHQKTPIRQPFLASWLDQSEWWKLYKAPICHMPHRAGKEEFLSVLMTCQDTSTVHTPNHNVAFWDPSKGWKFEARPVLSVSQCKECGVAGGSFSTVDGPPELEVQPQSWELSTVQKEEAVISWRW